MAISVSCPHCDNSFSVPDKYEGKRGKCPKCGEAFTASSSNGVAKPAFRTSGRAAPALANPAAAPVAVHEDECYSAEAPMVVGQADSTEIPSFDESSVTNKPTRSSSSGNRNKKKQAAPIPVWIWILLGVFGLGSVTGGVAFLMRDNGKDDEKISKNVTPVENKDKKKNTNRNKKDDDDIVPDSPIKRIAKKKSGKHTENVGPEYYSKHVKHGIVKIYNYHESDIMMGTGFFVNKKGWIATNHHVVENAQAMEIEISTGTRYPIKGYFLADPDQDLAVIIPETLPDYFTVLDIYPSNETIPESAPCIAVGHPKGNDFTVSRGVVGRVMNSGSLDDGAFYFLMRELGQSPNQQDKSMFWIRTDTLVQQGNSGGPLMNENWEVIGVNTFGNEDSQYSYASHVRHISAMIKKIETESIQVKPYPKKPPEWVATSVGRESPQALVKGKPGNSIKIPDRKKGKDDDDTTSVDPDDKNIATSLDKLFAELDKKNWKIESEKDHELCRKFALMLTVVGLYNESDDKIKATYQKIVKEISEIGWDQQEYKDINSLSNKHWDSIKVKDRGFKPGEGAFFFVETEAFLKQKERGKTLLLANVIGTDNSVTLVVNSSITEAQVPKNSKWLVMGVVARKFGVRNEKMIPFVIAKNFISVPSE